MADVGLAMQRAMDKTEQMKARASAVQELEAAGTFDDVMTLTPGEDDIDRQLKALSSTSEVDADLNKLKAELGMAPGPPGRARRARAGRARRRAQRRQRARRGSRGPPSRPTQSAAAAEPTPGPSFDEAGARNDRPDRDRGPV